jgi:hypothetical protein
MARQAALNPTRVTGRRIPWCVSVPPSLSESGARAPFLRDQDSGSDVDEQIKTRVLNHGIATHGLSAAQREAASATFRLLEGEPPSHLVDIVREHLRLKSEREKSVTFSELQNAFQ